MTTVLTLLMSNLKKWNVTHIFGIPGRPIAPLIKEMIEQDITYVLTRHETGAGYAAGGFALQKKNLGVAFATAGPGGVNMLTAAGQAQAHNVPVLFITGQTSAGKIGKSYSQDSSSFGADLVKMFEPVTKYSARVERGDSFESHFRHAIERAFSGVMGPVHLSIPLDVLYEEITPFEFELPQIQHTIAANIEEAFMLIKDAKRPVFLLGKGVRSSNSYEEVFEIATKWNIPVITTGGGKGTFPTNHPLSLGVYGLGGAIEADQYLQSGIDVMIVAGSSLNDMALAGFKQDFYPEKVIHFDYDPTFVGKTIPRPTLFVPGDLKRNLGKILELTLEQGVVGHDERLVVRELVAASSEYTSLNQERTENVYENLLFSSDFVATALEDKTIMLKEMEDFHNQRSKSFVISSASAIRTIRRNLPEYTKVFADVGSHAYYAVKHFDVYQPETFFFDDRFIAMGNGIGYAIGAKIAMNEDSQPVACITGDGCMLMHGTEIATAVEHQAPILFFVFNNGSLDMVETGMKIWQDCPGHNVYKKPVDFVSFAEALGCKGFRCLSEDDIQMAIQFGLQSNQPTIIEIMVDPEEIPPTLKRDE
ncbi:thiamine pyrophosphate-binding protein [Schinkia azotoformans]|uniref:thiamine pyrophosphate-binding protein n=1 Tax=Schinkia azotoformans TaxID=1454 RepID=UPI002DB6B0A0|nr:thiamine pyrophosphate-binding protein [Schinkia azotoformans]MEC1721462.1 thiamine pyrophosphate-binding protein [Schinkia azotoformans]MED4414720.1 thiamine pyrophosphate-binding protein [Schinkia azotoformans]